MLVPPHFLVSTAFKKMRWKDEFRKWLPKRSISSLLVKYRAGFDYLQGLNGAPCTFKKNYIPNVRVSSVL